ncbi:beta-lactamase [Vibrio parahaemolyticus 10329]|nr:beta-lactamase [Vibrio parahaemolyticus 10329]
MKKLFLLVGLMVCSTVSYASKLNEDISLIEKQTSGRIGVSVWDTQMDERWDYRGDERFPLMSTFKTLACATMLSDMDSGKLNKNATPPQHRHGGNYHPYKISYSFHEHHSQIDDNSSLVFLA